MEKHSDKEILEYFRQPLVKHKSKNPDTKIVGFKIYYGNDEIYTARGSYSHLFDEWKKAPYENIQIIMLYENRRFGEDKKHYRMSLSGFDYYLFDGKDFMACNDTRRFTNIPQNALKYGWYIDREKYSKIGRKAIKDFWLEGSR